MPEARIKLKVRKPSDAVSVIDIEGEVTAFGEPVLMDAYGEASDGGAGAIVLNFSGLEYMNSGGIGLLVTLLIRAQRQNQRLLAYGLNDHYKQIFELTRSAREENDFASEQFMAWFIREQVEEVAKMDSLLTVVNRANGDVEAIEEYVAREAAGGSDDPTAPRIAGA